jgi:hypothetical protein
LVASTSQRLVNRIIYNFVNQVVNCAHICATHVHAGAQSDVLDIFEYFDIVFGIGRRCGFIDHFCSSNVEMVMG